MNLRPHLLPAIVILASLGLLSKLFVIQIVDDTYKEVAENNHTMRVKERAYRGCIRDRNGQLLAYNVPVYDIMVTPKEFVLKDTLLFLERFGLAKEELVARLARARAYASLKPSLLFENLEAEAFAAWQGYLRDYPGLQVRIGMRREYATPHLGHVLGYMAEITAEEIAADSMNYYSLKDKRGATGLESYYENELRGEPSKRYIIVDVRGRHISSFAAGRYDTLAKPGKDLYLSIDLEMQSYAEELLKGHSGSIVALDPRNGEVLTFVSSPNYPPQALSGRNFTQSYQRLSQDSSRPLFNRPLQAMYRPGSIFKLAQALVALQLGAIHSNTVFRCDKRLVGCHAHGPQSTLHAAIQNSCNPYFYRVMQRTIQQGNQYPNPFRQARVGLKKWKEHMEDLGFGVALPIDIPYGKSGSIPSVSLYDRMYGPLRWKYSNIYSLSIGEGENLVVPLQMANFVSLVANGGYFYTPHVVHKIGAQATAESTYAQPFHVAIDKQHFDLLQQAMQDVVRYGTGFRAQIPDISVAGKTGSVQNKGKGDHSVFVCYAPVEDPRIALSVYVEHMGEGGMIAAAIAGLLIEKYLKGPEALLEWEPYVRNYVPPPPPHYAN